MCSGIHTLWRSNVLSWGLKPQEEKDGLTASDLLFSLTLTPARFCQTWQNGNISKLLIYVPQPKDVSGKNDPRCTVGSQRGGTLPWLLMTLHFHQSPAEHQLSSWLSCSVLTSVRPQLTHTYPPPPHTYINFKFSTFSFFGTTHYKKEVVLTHVGPFAVCSSLQLQQVRLLTDPMARLVSLAACSADRSMGITVNAPSCFCRVVECLLLMDTPVACFLRGRALIPLPREGPVDGKLFKMIRVTVHKINPLLLPPFTSVHP